MKVLLLLPVLLLAVNANQDSALSNAESPVEVLSFDWSKSRQVPPKSEPHSPAAPATVNRIRDRQRRAQAPIGQRDPSLDSIDSRSAAMDRVVEEARSAKPLDGFAYQVKLRNASSKVLTAVIWEYQFKESLNPTNVTRRQFVCGLIVKPQKNMDFRLFSTLGPSNIISVASLSNKAGGLFEETVKINFVEYSDGSFWQRKDWNSEEARRAYDRHTTRVSAQCLGL